MAKPKRMFASVVTSDAYAPQMPESVRLRLASHLARREAREAEAELPEAEAEADETESARPEARG